MAFGNSELVPGQGNAFPPSNFIDPTTRVPIVLGLTVSTCVLALALTGGRLYARAHMKRVLEVDDWMMLFAVFLAVVLTILGATSCLYGLGYHLWDTRPEWEEPYYKIGFAFSVIYPLCVGLTKMSICQTYLRIFPSQTSYAFSHATTAFVGIYTLICLILLFTQCHPIKAYWVKNIKIHCVDMHANMIAVGAINTVTDFLVYLWPARYLWRIRLPLKQRVGLVFVFTCGLIVCVAGVLRLIYLNQYFTRIDLFWDAALTTSVGIVEVNIGVVCGCLPCIKPLLIRVLPSLFSSHGRTSQVTHSGLKLGNIIAFRDISARQADASTSVLHENTWLEEIEEGGHSEGSSMRSPSRPSSGHQARMNMGIRRKESSTILKNGTIVVDQTITIVRV